MTAPPTGGPPEKEEPAPTPGRRPSQHLTNASECSRCVPEWKRRRAASRRLAILDSGRADPWQHDEVPLTDHQIDAWRRTVAHLTAAGFKVIIPAEVLEGLR